MGQLGEYVKMALKNIWANKVRTFLTMLGIIIGISSVILIISVGNGATGMITEQLGSIGKGQIAFYITDYQDKYYITQDDMDAIAKMDGIKAVTTQIVLEGTIRTRKDDFLASIIAADASVFSFDESTFVKGASFTDGDAESGKPVCVISENDAMKLFGSTNVAGLDLNLTLWEGSEMTVTIVGVTESKDKNAVIAMYEDPTVQIILPLMAVTTAVGMDISNEISDFYVLKNDDADATTACKEIINYLETKHHAKGQEIYNYQSFDDIMATVNQVIKLITVFVAFVASVSLLVGGIGVMNIMLVSVTERTREIGIRKALGAKTGSITVQFLAESAFITLIGGLIGILFGVLGAWIIAGIIGAIVPNMHFAPALSVGTVLLASAFSSGVGILFGVYPARKAAKLSPIEALRRN